MASRPEEKGDGGVGEEEAPGACLIGPIRITYLPDEGNKNMVPEDRNLGSRDPGGEEPQVWRLGSARGVASVFFRPYLIVSDYFLVSFLPFF